MSFYKILQLPYGLRPDSPYREEPKEYFGNRLVEFSPVFNRDGYYYDRKTKVAWYEVEGRAFIGSSDYFLYELQCLEAMERPFLQEEVDAVKILARNKRLPKALARRYQSWCEANECRNIGRNSRLCTMKSLKGI
jgi:hypothetical protein